MAPERPFPTLIETRKSYPKTGLSPAVSRRFDGGRAPPGSGPVRLSRDAGTGAAPAPTPTAPQVVIQNVEHLHIHVGPEAIEGLSHLMANS